MSQDVGIAERQNVQKQGRDDHIKQLSIQTPYISFRYTRSMEKDPRRVVVYLFSVIMFLYFLPFCYPYNLLYFKCFFVTCMMGTYISNLFAMGFWPRSTTYHSPLVRMGYLSSSHRNLHFGHCC